MRLGLKYFSARVHGFGTHPLKEINGRYPHPLVMICEAIFQA